MQWLPPLLQTLQVISSILIIVLVLLQQGKGADMGAAFGGGSAGSVFGSAGAANFLSRATKWAAIVFFATTGGLAWVAHHPSGSPIDSGVMQGFTTPAKESTPAGSAVPSVAPSAPASSSVPAANGGSTPGSAPADSASSVPAATGVPSVDTRPDPSVPSVPAK